MSKGTKLSLVMATAFLLVLPQAGTAQQGVADGVRLWSQNCGRCHNFRPPEERSDREWITIVAHMRARANMTKSAAEAVLAFLQSANGSESASASASTVEPPPVAADAAASAESEPLTELDELLRLLQRLVVVSLPAR